MNERLLPKNLVIRSLQPGEPHQVSRTEKPTSYPHRGDVPSTWTPDYQPTYFVDEKVRAGPEWAEPEDFEAAGVEREKRTGKDQLEELFPSYEAQDFTDGKPRNPRGPTGITGLGILGKHGANFACDPIVLRRFQPPQDNSSYLQMIAIKRRDNGRWAIPGGMADFGESVSTTLARELREEALGEGVPPDASAAWEEKFRRLFETHAFDVYQGAVDDFRNTDTSWMETAVKAFELTPELANELNWDMTLSAGDDAQEATWMTLTAPNLSQLHANHGDFVSRAVQLWEDMNEAVIMADGRIRKR